MALSPSFLPTHAGRLAALALPLLLLAACGGSSSNAPASTPPPPSGVVTTLPEGAWGGTQKYFNLSQTTTAVAIVLGSGEFRVITGTAFHFAGTLNQGLANGTAFSLLGLPPAPFTAKITEVTPKTSVTGTFTLGTDPTVFTFTTYGANYDTPLTLDLAAGSFVSPAAVNTLGQVLSLTLTATGTLTASSAAGDALAGTYTVPDPTKSGLTVAFTYTPPGGGAAEAMTGVGTLMPDPNGTVPSLTILATGTTRSMVLKFGKL